MFKCILSLSFLSRAERHADSLAPLLSIDSWEEARIAFHATSDLLHSKERERELLLRENPKVSHFFSAISQTTDDYF